MAPHRQRHAVGLKSVECVWGERQLSSVWPSNCQRHTLGLGSVKKMVGLWGRREDGAQRCPVTPRAPPPSPCRLRDKAQIAERCRGGRQLTAATVLEGALPPLPPPQQVA